VIQVLESRFVHSAAGVGGKGCWRVRLAAASIGMSVSGIKSKTIKSPFDKVDVDLMVTDFSNGALAPTVRRVTGT